MGKLDTKVVSTGYKPRPYQEKLHKALGKARFSVQVWHRRSGKTVSTINDLIDKALHCERENPQYGYVAPSYGQAKRVSWQYFKKFTKDIPTVEYHEGELRVTIHRPSKGDKITIYLLGAENPDSLAGLYLDGVILDEYSLMNPNIWTLIIRPALADRKGWAMFIGTPRGANHFFDLYMFAKAHPETWYTTLMTVEDTGAIDKEELELLKQEMSEEQYNQEMMCSFSAAITGAYYGNYIAQAEKDSRITAVSYDLHVPVETAWDLGIGDATAIWFFQRCGTEIHYIDYYESSGVGLEHYVKIIKEKPYIYETHWLPHDAQARSLETGNSRIETLRKMGLGRLTVLPRLSIEDGIHAARMVFPRSWFDLMKCERGLSALRNYQKKWDAKTKTYLDTPLHDWSSNGADAFRYSALAIRPNRRIIQDCRQLPTYENYNILE